MYIKYGTHWYVFPTSIAFLNWKPLALYPGGFPRRYTLAVKLLENRLYMYHQVDNFIRMVKFGRSVRLSGQQNSAVRFLFIRLSRFGRMG